MQYLLDTNICVFLFRGSERIAEKMELVGKENCFVSDVTVAELRYGVECSKHRERNEMILNEFLEDVGVIPFDVAINNFAKEKARLRKLGQKLDDFDLLIGCTATACKMTVVTDNAKHFQRIKDIQLENWVER